MLGMEYRLWDQLGLQGSNVELVKIQLTEGKFSQNHEGTAGTKQDLSYGSEVGSLGSPSSG